MGFKSDIEIAQEAKPQDIREVAKKLGLGEEDIELYGKYKAKVDYNLLKRRAIINCEITCISSNALYLDCGGGVQGRVDISEAIIPFVRDLRDSGFKKGEIIPCEIIGFDDSTCKLTLSFQKACNITYSCGYF